MQTRHVAKMAGPRRKSETTDPDPSCGGGGEGSPRGAKGLKMASREEGTRLGGGDQQGALDGSSTTSRKKQKDRANQESREVKRAVAAGVVVGGNGDAKRGTCCGVCVWLSWLQLCVCAFSI